MTVNIHRIISHNILDVAFSGHVGEVDFDEMGKAGISAAQRGAVYAIVDFSQVASLPRNLMNTALRSSALLAFAAHPNARYFVFASPNQATRFVIDTVFRSVPYKIVADYDTGLDVLYEEIIPNDSQAS